jgi:hypothetical protein
MKESDIQNEQKSDLPESPRKSFFLAPKAIKGKIEGALDRRKEKLANEDPIFIEPITPEEPPKAEPLVKGNVDVWFLLWAMVLICFGAIMSYSASAVYAEQKYDDSTYFLLRYVLFAVAAIAVTLPFVMLHVRGSGECSRWSLTREQ